MDRKMKRMTRRTLRLRAAAYIEALNAPDAKQLGVDVEALIARLADVRRQLRNLSH